MSQSAAPPRRSQRILHQLIPPWLANDCEMLVRNDPGLTVLVRPAKIMGEHGAVAIGMALKQNRTLKELFLGWNEIGNRGIEAIAYGLGQRPVDCPILEELNITCNGIDHHGIAALVNGLGTKRKLVLTLNLSYNEVGSAGARVLADWLQQQNKNDVNQPEILCLGSSSIGNEGACSLGTVLKKCRHLKVLYLNENSIDGDGACAISHGLASPECGLQSLDLRGNVIGDQGAQALGDALKHNTSLKTLCLSMNSIGGNGIEAIAHGLQHNTSLETLTLLRNRPSIESAVALLEVLKTQNKTLQWLYIVPFKFDALDNDRRALVRVQAQITYYCALNRAGRQYIGDVKLPCSLWPRIFSRISKNESLLYGFVREKPDLFQRCDIVATTTRNAQATSVIPPSKKRQHQHISG